MLRSSAKLPIRNFRPVRAQLFAIALAACLGGCAYGQGSKDIDRTPITNHGAGFCSCIVAIFSEIFEICFVLEEDYELRLPAADAETQPGSSGGHFHVDTGVSLSIDCYTASVAGDNVEARFALIEHSITAALIEQFAAFRLLAEQPRQSFLSHGIELGACVLRCRFVAQALFGGVDAVADCIGGLARRRQ